MPCRSDEDLVAFKATLPSPPPINDATSGRPAASYAHAYRFADMPIRVSSICRKVHSALTGPRARQNDDVDEEKLLESWVALDRCWRELDDLRHYGLSGILQEEDIERFIDSWKV